MRDEVVDVVVVGGGQAGLAAAYHLRRTKLSFVVLDDQEGPGGAWPHTWPTLRLFSPAEFASLPGWMMPPWPDGFPPARHVVDYLAAYEHRYRLPVVRPARVHAVLREPGRLRVESSAGVWRARAVVSATGTWQRPFWPAYPGARLFGGSQIHTVHYRSADEFAGRKVVVVGGGNSGAQLVAEISAVADTVWVTSRPPRFLPDDVDGRVLFQLATKRALELAAGRPDPGGISGLGDIVMVPEVKAARDRGDLEARPMFKALSAAGVCWSDREEPVDAVVWATGFRPALAHLRPLRLHAGGAVAVAGTRSLIEPWLHLLGYGDWTGPGSATILGVGRTAKAAVAEIVAQSETGLAQSP